MRGLTIVDFFINLTKSKSVALWTVVAIVAVGIGLLA